MTRIEILFEHNADSRERQKQRRAETKDNLKTKQVQQLRPPPAGPSWKIMMKKQVKVDVSWNDRLVQLSTDRGMTYYFQVGGKLPLRGSCESIVSSLVSSLILSTIKAAFYASDNNEFTFEFKVIDKKES